MKPYGTPCGSMHFHVFHGTICLNAWKDVTFRMESYEDHVILA